MPAFMPNVSGTVTSAKITGSSQTIALSKGNVVQQIMVQLAGATPAVAFIEFGGPEVAATIATGMPILPGSPYLFTVGPNVTSVAIIGSAGTMYFTGGIGSG
jgi:hypothetical protein